jgi:hypothetical protein
VTDEELFELIVDAPAGDRAALFDRHCAGDGRTWQARWRQPLPAASETNDAGHSDRTCLTARQTGCGDGMDKSGVLSSDGEGLSPGEAVRRLRSAFPLLRVNDDLGGWRVGRRLRKLREMNAPDVILRFEERRQKTAVQASAFDEPNETEVLDLTLHEGWARAYHREGAEGHLRRAAEALGYQVAETEHTGIDDLRDTPEERRYWARVRETREAVAKRRSSFEGATALFQEGSTFALLKVQRLALTEARFSADVEPIPSRGFRGMPSLTRITWWWDEFSCGPDWWTRGPGIVQKILFGETAAAAVRYCESLPDSDAGVKSRREVARGIREQWKAAAGPYICGPLELFWMGASVGVVTEHRLDDFPMVRGKFAAVDPAVAAAKAFTWWMARADTAPVRAAQDEGNADSGEPEDDDALQASEFPDELFSGWWLRAPDGARLDVGLIPRVDLRAGNINWNYSRRTLK